MPEIKKEYPEAEKETKRELTKEEKEIRSFFIDELPMGSRFENSPTDKLFTFYQEFINQDVSLENFKKLLKSADGAKMTPEDQEKLNIFYRQYLLKKLPREIAERFKNDGIEQLEEIHAEREKEGYALKLGFHLSDADYREAVPPSQIESVSTIEGKTVVVPAHYSHYTVSSRGLPKFRSGYLYFVEGSEGDIRAKSMPPYVEIHKKAGWVATARPLPILKKVKLTDELTKALKLDFY